MLKLFLASNNPGKLKEIQALLNDLDLELVTPRDLGLDIDVDESGESYAENARLKAVTFAHVSKLLTMADDSGLEVDALNGAPGLHSARYSPKTGASDADRRAYLLENLQGISRPWLAKFRCVICLVTENNQLHFFEGICPGEIIPEERGYNGFGYDPIFMLPQLGRTMAELEMQEKNLLSHRARAVTSTRPFLKSLLQSSDL